MKVRVVKGADTSSGTSATKTSRRYLRKSRSRRRPPEITAVALRCERIVRLLSAGPSTSVSRSSWTPSCSTMQVQASQLLAARRARHWVTAYGSVWKGCATLPSPGAPSCPVSALTWTHAAESS